MLDIRGTILELILQDVRVELEAVRHHRPLPEIQRRMADAPPPRSLKTALLTGFGLIAEIKVCSPSQGTMRTENVAEAPAAYERSPIVRALSVLTNATHFGMSIERLEQIRAATTKPVLRKDFIFDEYQVYEARAFGADAILLMANLLEPDELARLHQTARELGLDVLFECQSRAQIEVVPAGAEIYGINSRTFSSGADTYQAARQHRQAGGQEDLSTDLRRFDLVGHLPAHTVKVAESGVSADTVARLRDDLGYHAALVGTSLLLSPHGVDGELQLFEQALAATCSRR
jgi:indole-3-glycerol phosphate synthase